MIYKEARKKVTRIIHDWQDDNNTNIRIPRLRYTLLVGGLMYTDDIQRIKKDVIADLEALKTGDTNYYIDSE